MKLKLHDIRESKVWQQAHAEGADENARKFIDPLVANGKTHEEIAELLKISEREIKRFANGQPR